MNKLVSRGWKKKKKKKKTLSEIFPSPTRKPQILFASYKKIDKIHTAKGYNNLW